MHIFVFGGTGYIGGNLADAFAMRGNMVTRIRTDITDISAVRRALADAKPDVVINAAGITGTPNVDWCEDHPAEAYGVNVVGALNIAIVCREMGVYMAHIGSGCIYAGDNEGSGFTEDDAPNYFDSLYSRTKAVSEASLRDFDVLQLRVRIPISGVPHPKNVINKLLKYEKVLALPNSYTVLEDFVPAVLALVDRQQTGVFNMTNVGATDNGVIMRLYHDIVDSAYTPVIMDPAELSHYAKAGRSNCVLDTHKREALGISMPDIVSRLPDILARYKTHL